MSDHTDGPWQAIASIPNVGFDCFWIMSQPVGTRGFTNEVATVIGPQSDKEHEANARLIAAAPDMLAALKNAIARADAHVGGFPEGRHPDCKKDYDMCVAAIKKAEGK